MSQVTRLVYDTKVWAIIGGPDGTSTHLAEQVIAKSRLVLLSPGSTDTTAHQANVPWMFSCLPSDQLLAPPLVDHLANVVAGRPFAVVSADDHDSRRLVSELTRCFTEKRTSPQFEYVFHPGQVAVPRLAEQLIRSQPEAIVLVAAPGAGARLVRALRERGYDKLILGGPAFGRRQFVEQVGDVVGEVVFPLLWQPTPEATKFAIRFRAAHQITPDYAAAASYDAVRLLAAAVGQAGLHRTRIGDALRQLTPYQGISGSIRWNERGENRRGTPLGTIRQGQVQPFGHAPEAPTSGSLRTQPSRKP